MVCQHELAEQRNNMREFKWRGDALEQTCMWSKAVLSAPFVKDGSEAQDGQKGVLDVPSRMKQNAAHTQQHMWTQTRELTSELVHVRGQSQPLAGFDDQILHCLAIGPGSL